MAPKKDLLTKTVKTLKKDNSEWVQSDWGSRSTNKNKMCLVGALGLTISLAWDLSFDDVAWVEDYDEDDYKIKNVAPFSIISGNRFGVKRKSGSGEPVVKDSLTYLRKIVDKEQVEELDAALRCVCLTIIDMYPARVMGLLKVPGAHGNAAWQRMIGIITDFNDADDTTEQMVIEVLQRAAGKLHEQKAATVVR